MASSSGGSSGYRQLREQEAQFLNTIRNQGVQIRQFNRSLKDLGVLESERALPFLREGIDAEVRRLDELKQRMTSELEDLEAEIQSTDLPSPAAPPSSDDVKECVDKIANACEEEALLAELLKRMPSLPLPQAMESYDRMVREAHATLSSLIDRVNVLESSQAESNASLQKLSTSLLESLPGEAQIKEYESFGLRVESMKQDIANQLLRLQQLQVRLETANGQIKELEVLRKIMVKDQQTILSHCQELSRLRDVESKLTAAQNESQRTILSQRQELSHLRDVEGRLKAAQHKDQQTMLSQNQELSRLRDVEGRLTAAQRKDQQTILSQNQELSRLRDVESKLTAAQHKDQHTMLSQNQELSRLRDVESKLTAAQHEISLLRDSEQGYSGRCNELSQRLSLETTQNQRNAELLVAEQQLNGQLVQQADILWSSLKEGRGFASQLEGSLQHFRWEFSDLEESLRIANSRIVRLLHEKNQAKLESEVEEATSKEGLAELHLRLERLEVSNNDQTDEIASLKQMRDVLANEVHLMLLAQETIEAKFAAEVSSRDGMIEYYAGQSDQLEEQLRNAKAQNESLDLQIGAEQMSSQDLQKQLQVSQIRLADLDSAVSSGRLHSDCRNRYSSLHLLHKEAEREVSRLDGIHFQRTYQMAALREDVRELNAKLETYNISFESQSQILQRLDQDKRKMESRHQQSTENIQMILGAVLSVDISPLGFSIETIAQISRALVCEELNYSASSAWIAEFNCFTDDKAHIDDWHMLRCFLEMNIMPFDDLRAAVSHIDSRDRCYCHWTVSIMLAFIEHISDVTVSQLSVSEAISMLSLSDLVNRYLHGTSMSGRLAASYNQLQRNLTGASESSPLVGGLADCVSRGLSGLRQPLHQLISNCAAQRQLSMSNDGTELILDQKRLILLSKSGEEHPMTLVWPGQFRLVAGATLVLKVVDQNQRELRSFAWDLLQDRSGATMAGKLFRHTLRHLSRENVGRGFQA